MADLSQPAAALGLGMVLGAAPGPVQVLLLGEAARGGARRGLAAMAGANGTFGVLLLLLAAGVTISDPSEGFLRVIRIAGGIVLLWLAALALIEALGSSTAEPAPPRLPPFARGVMAVLFNPGAWIFLATTASALLVGAAAEGGRAFAFATAAAMLVGVMVVDAGTVLLGAGGQRYLSRRASVALGVGLACALAALGGWLLFQGAIG